MEPFDTAHYLDNPEVISHYLAEALESGDHKLIVRAITNVLRASRIADIANATGHDGGNIFADLGLPNADEHMLKARLVMCIDKMIEQAGLTQQAAAKTMGISQPDVSNLLRGRFEGFSLERLLGFVRALDGD